MTSDEWLQIRMACELLGLGDGCRDGGCILAGPGARPGAQRTNGGCKCLDHWPNGKRRTPSERQAIRAAIKAAADKLGAGA